METEQNQQEKPENSTDELSMGLQVLSFCIPLAGIIIYFSNKDSSPQRAKSACTAAWMGIGLGIILNILATLGRH